MDARKEAALTAKEFAETDKAQALCAAMSEATILEEDGIILAGAVVTGDDAGVDGNKTLMSAAGMRAEAHVEVVRLEKNETSFVAIPYIGNLQSIKPSDVVSLFPNKNDGNIGLKKFGEFGIFSTPPSHVNSQWIALPMWQAVKKSSPKLFATTTPTWRKFPGLNIRQLDDERFLVLADAEMNDTKNDSTTSEKDSGKAGNISASSYYLVWQESKSSGLLLDSSGNKTTSTEVRVVTGLELIRSGITDTSSNNTSRSGMRVFAKVLLGCLPPSQQKMPQL